MMPSTVKEVTMWAHLKHSKNLPGTPEFCCLAGLVGFPLGQGQLGGVHVSQQPAQLVVLLISLQEHNIQV